MEVHAIRPFRIEDAGETAQLFYDSVHIGARDRYTAEQRRAWTRRVPELDEWSRRLSEQTCLIAEVDGRAAGFMTLRSDGYIDLAFVAPNLIGEGIGHALYKAIESSAMHLGISRLTSEASHMARPFFERQGWAIVNEQEVFRENVSLTNFVMEKRLAP